MAQATTNNTATGTNFTTTSNRTDLIPGDLRGVTAAADNLTASGGTLDDVTTTLAATTRSLPWNGPAADALATHQRTVLHQTDRWQDALHAVLDMFDDHHTVLAKAQDDAERALTLWATAHRQAAQFGRFDVSDSPASNAALVQTRLHSDLTAATRRAHALLSQARTDLNQAGDAAAEAVHRATEMVRTAPLPSLPTLNTDTAASAPCDRTVTVQPPDHGVHDTLSRIAARTLGDPNRWSEIYRLNVGHAVGDHAVLHNPNLIQPGWTLRLPNTIAAPPAPALHHTDQQAPGVATTPQPATGTTPMPVPNTTVTPHHTPAPQPDSSLGPPQGVRRTAPVTHGAGDHGVDLGGGLVLAGGVTATVIGIAVATGIRHRFSTSRTLDSSRQPEPEVRTLTPDQPPLAQPEQGGIPPAPAAGQGGSSGLNSVQFTGPAEVRVPLGHRDGRTVLLDIAATLGLGLTGSGAVIAARAVLISALAAHSAATALLTTPLRDLLLRSPGSPPSTGTTTAVLFDEAALPETGGRICVLSEAEDVLARAEAEILTRTRLVEESAGQHTAAPLILMMSAPADSRRLQAVADLGAGLGIIVVVLGAWPAGITCVIGADGRLHQVLGHQVPAWTAALAGLRVFTAGPNDTQVLLTLLGRLDPRIPSLRPDRTYPEPAPGRTGKHLDNETASVPGPLAPRVSPGVGRVLAGAAQQVDENGSHPEPSRIAHLLSPGIVSQTESPDGTAQRRAATDATIQPSPSPHRAISQENSTVAVPPLRLNVLDRVTVTFHPDSDPADITAALAPKQRQILIYLALHPGGVRRDTLTAALWPDASPDRPHNTFHATLSQLRRSVRTATNKAVDTLITSHDGQYALDPATVDVDLWHLHNALQTHSTELTADRIRTLRHALTNYQGELANGIHADWLDAPREQLRHNVLDVLSTLIHTIREQDPKEALGLLEQARQFDPHNEAIYRDIMRTHAKLGHHDAVPRTLHQLVTALRDIDTAPSAGTQALAAQLQHRHPAAPDPATSTTGTHRRSP